MTGARYRFEWGKIRSWKDAVYSVGAFSVQTHKCDQNHECHYGLKKCLCIMFIFQRRLTTALISTYFPSTLIVLIAFVSFWIDPLNATPGRITLVVTSLLALVTQLLSVRTRMVPVSYVTALDIWFFACLTLVSVCLFEFSLAYSSAKKVTQ